MKKQYMVIGIFAFSLIAFFLYIQSVNSIDDGEKAYKQRFKEDYHIYSPEVPHNIDFAGEKAPTNIFYVYENFEKEVLVNTYWHSNTLLLFKRANRWFPVIEPILKANNIPDDFKYMALIESGLQNISSPSGAKGYWQILDGTAKEYGLEINDAVDERNNVEKQTEAVCKYLNNAYHKFGSWTLAASSFNQGMYGLAKLLDLQKTKSFYELSLNIEASRYIYRLLAVKSIFSNPKNYGFYLRPTDLYPEIKYTIVEIDSSITNVADFAKTFNISYRMLKELNPWLLTTSLPNASAKKYQIKIPQEEMINYFELKDKQSKNIGVFGDL